MKLFAPLMIALGLGLATPVFAQPAPVVDQQTAAAAEQQAATNIAASPGTIAAAETPSPAPALPGSDPKIGQPVDRGIGLQPQVTAIGQYAEWFHNTLLMWTITLISLFVLALLLWTVIRYNRRSNPEPSKTSHNTLVEVAWTLIPVLILVALAVPSISLLLQQYKPAGKDALTIKAIGNQWYWTYEYPDNGGFEVVQNMLPDAEAKRQGKPRLLGTDNPIVIPVGTTIRLLTTANDVIHAWAMPAFWTKMDAVPGRTNEATFRVDKVGTYYGQCSELCGARHAFMPIEVSVVPRAQFDAWVRSKGGTVSAGSAESAAKAANASGSNGQVISKVPGEAPAEAGGAQTAPDSATVPSAGGNTTAPINNRSTN